MEKYYTGISCWTEFVKRPGNPRICWHGNIKMKAGAEGLVAGLSFWQRGLKPELGWHKVRIWARKESHGLS